MSGGPAGWLRGQRVKQVLNSRSQEISSVRPVENWDGARIRLDVEKRPEAQASVEVELEGWVFFHVYPVESADSGLQMFLTLKAQQKAGSPGRQVGTPLSGRGALSKPQDSSCAVLSCLVMSSSL